MTAKSATARETQSGASGPKPKSGKISTAHEISLPGSIQTRLCENAMVKKRAVSIAEPATDDMIGGCHQILARSRSKIVTSTICAVKKAMPEPSATRTVTSGPYSPTNWVPISEHKTPIKNPTHTTRRAGSHTVKSIRQICDQKCKRVSQGAPGKPLPEQFLNKDIRNDNYCCHCNNAKNWCVCLIFLPHRLRAIA